MSKHNRSVRRRRTRSLVGFAAKDLCETIPVSLEPSKRLLILLENCFLYALSVVQKEFIEKEHIDTFRQKGTECWEKIKTDIETKNLIQTAVADNKLQNESLLNANVEHYNETMAILQAESDKWSEIVAHYRKGLEKKMNCSYDIPASEGKDSSELYDYSDMLKAVSAEHEKLSLKVNKASSTSSVFKECLQIHNRLQNSLIEKCEDYFRPSIQDSPKTLIKRMKLSRAAKGKRTLNCC